MTCTFIDGDEFKGEFKNDEKHGFGTYTFADGRRYEGHYKNGKESGIHVYYASPNSPGQKIVWKKGGAVSY